MPITTNEPKLTTSIAARIANRSGATILQWERKGWLHSERTASGIRLFDPAEVRRIAAERGTLPQGA